MERKHPWEGAVIDRLLEIPSTREIRLPELERLSVDEALSVINARYAISALSPEDVSLRRMALCNDQYDRTHERFSESFLKRLAETIVGKSVLAHHDKRDYPLGRFYRASVQRDASGWLWLSCDCYMLKSPENEALRREIDAGVVSFVSVGFRGGTCYCDLCGLNVWSWDCPHMPGRSYDTDRGRQVATATWQDPEGTAEAVEGSFVWLGAQYEARIIKSARKEVRDVKSIEELTAEVKGLVEERERLKVLLAEEKRQQQATEQRVTEALNALAQSTAMLDEQKPLSEDGKQYRADLIAEIARLGGVVGSEKEAATVGAALAPGGVKALKEARDEYQKRVDERFPPQPVGQAAPPAKSEQNSDERLTDRGVYAVI